MTVGLPGTGIGGMFYLLSALLMPLREAYHRVRRGRGRGRGPRQTGRWGVVAGQIAIAGGIIVGLWATGWLLGLGLAAARPVVPLIGRAHAGNVLRIATFVLTFGTLAVVLLGVELLRLWHPRRPRHTIPPELSQRRRAAAGRSRPRERTLVVWFLCAAVAGHARIASAQRATQVASRLARADSALRAGDAGAAEHEYAAVLATDSGNSRAIYRLAQLRRSDPAAALPLFQRYVALVPRDPWGYMAVGDALARLRRYREALEWYDRALRLAPAERDAVVGRAGVLARARRTDAAIVAYREWLTLHPSDAQSWRELARQESRAGRPRDAARALERAQALAPDAATAWRLALARAAAAPALTPLLSGSHDSDGNSTLRWGGAAEFPAAEGTAARLGVAATHERAANGATTAGLDELALRGASQPVAALTLDAAAGATRLDPGGGRSATVTPTGQLRVRWRAPEAGPALDLRVRRSVLDATPQLVTNRVVRSELGGLAELPLGGALKLRAIGRFAAISDSTEVNHRTTVAGIVAVAATPAVELSGQFHQISYARPTTAGYFAPRLAQVAQAGSYIELETASSAVFACDLGVGVQRAADHGARFGPWRRAFSLYALVTAPLAPGRELRLELDIEDSPVAAESATTGQWRYDSAVLSLRWALP